MLKRTLDLEHKLHLDNIQAAKRAFQTADQVALQCEAEQDEVRTECTSFELLRKRFKMDEAKCARDVLKAQADSLSYHLEIGHTLMKYYDIAEGATLEGEGAKLKEPKNSILTYFKTKEPVDPVVSGDAYACTRASLMDAYLSATGKSPKVRTCTHSMCNECGSSNTVTFVLESQRICSDCDAVEYVILDNERAGSGGLIKDGMFHFKRINHLNEILNSSEGKEHAMIPDVVFTTILEELKKQKVVNMVDVKKEHIKAILKKTQLSKYYEHASYIVSQLNGRPTKPFHPSLVNKIKKMFVQIQPPFSKHAPLGRKNFLSYNYVLYKFCELLEEDEYLDRFPLLKSSDKLCAQDEIWKNICADLQWQYIPSI